MRPFPENQVWVAYNYVPGGQIIAQHFEDVKRERKGPEGVEKLVFRAEDFVDGLRKSDYVALNVNGKLERNKLLVFPRNRDLRHEKDPASVVIAWAKEQGLQPVPDMNAPAKPETPAVSDGRIQQLEKIVSDLQAQNDQLKTQNLNTDRKIDQILDMLTSKKDGDSPDEKNGGE